MNEEYIERLKNFDFKYASAKKVFEEQLPVYEGLFSRMNKSAKNLARKLIERELRAGIRNAEREFVLDLEVREKYFVNHVRELSNHLSEYLQRVEENIEKELMEKIKKEDVDYVMKDFEAPSYWKEEEKEEKVELEKIENITKEGL